MPLTTAPASIARHLRRAVAVHGNNVLARLAALTGDPYGRLEHDPDLLSLGEDLRTRPFVRSWTGIHLSARYDVCSAVLRSPHASSAPPAPDGWLQRLLLAGPAPGPEHADPVLESFVCLDGDDHARLRRLVQPAFSRSAIAAMEARTTRVAHDLLDAFDPRRPVDLVTAFAAPLPMQVICELLDVPVQDRDRFAAWGDALATGLDRARTVASARRIEAAIADSSTALGALVAERRRRPGRHVPWRRAAGPHGDPRADPAVGAPATFQLVAGFETTVNLIGRGTELLLAHPDQLAAIAADPDRLVPELVEEALRFTSPVQYTFRTLRAPLALPDGTELPAGAEFVLLLAAANRDPAVFDTPDRFDVGRGDARRHLAFGLGAHHCLGAALARLEATAAWRALFERFDPAAWRLAGTPEPSAGRMIRGLRSLPVHLGADRSQPARSAAR